MLNSVSETLAVQLASHEISVALPSHSSLRRPWLPRRASTAFFFSASALFAEEQRLCLRGIKSPSAFGVCVQASAPVPLGARGEAGGRCARPRSCEPGRPRFSPRSAASPKAVQDSKRQSGSMSPGVWGLRTFSGQPAARIYRSSLRTRSVASRAAVGLQTHAGPLQLSPRGNAAWGTGGESLESRNLPVPGRQSSSGRCAPLKTRACSGAAAEASSTRGASTAPAFQTPSASAAKRALSPRVRRRSAASGLSSLPRPPGTSSAVSACPAAPFESRCSPRLSCLSASPSPACACPAEPAGDAAVKASALSALAFPRSHSAFQSLGAAKFGSSLPWELRTLSGLARSSPRSFQASSASLSCASRPSRLRRKPAALDSEALQAELGSAPRSSAGGEVGPLLSSDSAQDTSALRDARGKTACATLETEWRARQPRRTPPPPQWTRECGEEARRRLEEEEEKKRNTIWARVKRPIADRERMKKDMLLNAVAALIIYGISDASAQTLQQRLRELAEEPEEGEDKRSGDEAARLSGGGTLEDARGGVGTEARIEGDTAFSRKSEALMQRVSQTAEGEEHLLSEGKEKEGGNGQPSWKEWDWRRTVSLALEGFIINGFLLTAFYHKLEVMLHDAALSASPQPGGAHSSSSGVAAAGSLSPLSSQEPAFALSSASTSPVSSSASASPASGSAGSSSGSTGARSPPPPPEKPSLLRRVVACLALSSSFPATPLTPRQRNLMLWRQSAYKVLMGQIVFMPFAALTLLFLAPVLRAGLFFLFPPPAASGPAAAIASLPSRAPAPPGVGLHSDAPTTAVGAPVRGPGPAPGTETASRGGTEAGRPQGEEGEGLERQENWLRLACQEGLLCIRQSLREVYVASWYVWPLSDVINFRFIPLTFRPLWDTTLDLFWTVYLSAAAYPRGLELAARLASHKTQREEPRAEDEVRAKSQMETLVTLVRAVKIILFEAPR
ncbi:Mpv17 / PMP22 family protein [Besnoitia besnoiti]|uniref:Mpv17 / PMP22 family protein n=1 Tax=Besnoitia besnoiti TaxID=94643 RepID=A0A2A9MHL7_BESBE|nr:Mpv17 / PMP22 family protein [Besnoitia besnoiti]PFH37389.1 Mpv17 / PMP22 family protein [Besnoitia besnoiti]